MKKNVIIIVLLILAFTGGYLISTKSQSQYAHFYTGAPISPVPAEDVKKLGYPESRDSFSTTDRKLIKTAQLNVEVEDFQTAFDEVVKISEEFDGFVADSSAYETVKGHMRGSVVVRLPEANFLDAIERFSVIGKVKSKRITGEDVTEEYVDLEARLNNYKRQEERFLEILDNATNVEEILKVEEQLGRVRGEIERLTGRIRYLDNRIELATITIELFEPEPITQSWGLRDALRRAFGGFISTANGIIVFTGSVLPLVIIALFVYFIYIKMYKSKAGAQEKKEEV